MAVGPHAEIISPYFKHMKELMIAGIVTGDVDVGNLRKTAAKKLYASYTSSFPPPKVVYKFEVDWDRVWIRLQSPMLEYKQREVLFMIVHNIVPNRDRLHNKFHMVPNENCIHCEVLHDNAHIFCECQLVREAWFWFRQRLLGMFPASHGNTSNFEFLHLMFDSYLMENEVIWMLGIWVELVWNSVICKKKSLSLERAKTEFSIKLANHKYTNLPAVAHIIGLQV